MWFIVLICSIMAFYEAGLGVLQAVGLQASGNPNYAITGTFANPGPYGGLIAVLLSVLIAYVWCRRDSDKIHDKLLRWFSMLSAAFCIVVLPATMSRAAWLSLGVAMLVLGFKEMKLGQWIRSHRIYAGFIAVVIVALMAAVFVMKKDSAIGRFHIWHMELRAIAEEPWTGHGRGMILGAYGDAQAEYFAEKERPETIVRVAGCPEYAFNEYLKIGVEFGLPAMLLVVAGVVAVILVLLQRSSPSAYGVIALAVFSFFSYPFSLISHDEKEVEVWQSSRMLCSIGLYEDFIEEMRPHYEALADRFRFVYDYGYALHQVGRYEESIEVLGKGAAISSDPMFHNIIGKNLEALGRFEEAEKSYLHAHHMVPCRLYPLKLLMDMKIRQQETEDALLYARKIVSMPVNERHLAMVRLQDEAKECLDSLCFKYTDSSVILPTN